MKLRLTSIRHFLFQQCRLNHSKKGYISLSKTRNIGILAHIDAGKTTTTERMLYYSGKIKNMGEVHKGNTVTDYMEQERNRGITITSACVTFEWNGHLINLVDTPGHIDFTVEVEQALNVIDSAVVVLDGTEGVEVQTITVWRQADRTRLPRLVYVNKMDRPDSDIDLCENSLREKLSATPLLLHVPLKDKSGFRGVVDLVSMKKLIWLTGNVSYSTLEKSDEIYSFCLEKRNKLIDDLSSFDDNLANFILDGGSFDIVKEEKLRESVRKITLAKQGVPVLCGSSYKNVGIEPLLDGIINYLPCPTDVIDQQFHDTLKDELLAKSFKVMHDKQKGPLVFFRIYNGKLSKGEKIFDSNQEKTDQIGHVYMPFADELTEVPVAKTGDFVVANGLKIVQNGDIVCNSATSAKRLKELASKHGESNKLLHQTHIPKPVFFCSVEPPSQAYQLALERALAELSREDPSLKVTYDSDSGQTVLGGMGELHLEIIKDRLLTEYKIDADLGPLQIVYKEKPLVSVKETHILRNMIASTELQVSITLGLKVGSSKDLLRVDSSKDASPTLTRITPRLVSAIKHGISSALYKGPLMSSEVIECSFVLYDLEMSKRTPEPLLIAAASQCVDKLLKKSGTQLLEPVMDVNIIVNEPLLSSVQNDLARRRANIYNITTKYNTKEISCEVPLSELVGYATHLRTVTSGSARFTMEFKCYKEMLPGEQEQVISGLM